MKIEIFHDTVCPWCRIGKKNLSLALEQWQGEPTEINYRAFFLNPNIPREGVEFQPYMQAKGGGQIPLEAFFDRPREMGTKVGLTFNFEQITRAPNSMLSHCLIYLTPKDQRETMIDNIYTAYFEDGQDIGNLDVLVDIAASLDLNPEQVRTQLEQGNGREKVLADVEFARQVGISGVPFFILNDYIAFSGAQPPETMIRILQQTAENE